VISCEGGHADFPPRSAEDFELYEFAKHYVEHSDNVENERAKGKVYRISMERVCAGPAVPLIYEFMKKKYPDLPRILEPEKAPKDIRSYDVIKAAMEQDDELCMKVVYKFSCIYATEVGNFALKTLPYGGIFLVGGVTMGISKYLIEDNHFREVFFNKGRFESMMRRFPLILLKPEIELGILGATEAAFRSLGSYK
jgi:glucokinase